MLQPQATSYMSVVGYSLQDTIPQSVQGFLLIPHSAGRWSKLIPFLILLSEFILLSKVVNWKCTFRTKTNYFSYIIEPYVYFQYGLTSNIFIVNLLWKQHIYSGFIEKIFWYPKLIICFLKRIHQIRDNIFWRRIPIRDPIARMTMHLHDKHERPWAEQG